MVGFILNFSKSRVSCRPSFPETGDAVRFFFSTFCCAAPFAVIVLKFLNQFTAPCDALWAWPFSSPTCWNHFVFFLDLFLPPGSWPLSASGMVWAFLPGSSYPTRIFPAFPKNRVPSSPSVGLQAGANPAPASLCMLILVFGLVRMLTL